MSEKLPLNPDEMLSPIEKLRQENQALSEDINALGTLLAGLKDRSEEETTKLLKSIFS